MLGLQWNYPKQISTVVSAPHGEIAYPLIDSMSRVLPDDTVSLGLDDRFNLVTDIPEPTISQRAINIPEFAHL